MTRPASNWNDLDREVVRIIKNLWEEDERHLSLRALAKQIGVSHPRLSDIFKCEHGKPTLDEVVSLCLVFGKDPGTILSEARKNVS
jgi:AraC-like DNA-binding protein|nr:MAG TPA: helix-turn-helix domain protein [Bacteriophage sp.]